MPIMQNKNPHLIGLFDREFAFLRQVIQSTGNTSRTDTLAKSLSVLPHEWGHRPGRIDLSKREYTTHVRRVAVLIQIVGRKHADQRKCGPGVMLCGAIGDRRRFRGVTTRLARTE